MWVKSKAIYNSVLLINHLKIALLCDITLYSHVLINWRDYSKLWDQNYRIRRLLGQLSHTSCKASIVSKYYQRVQSNIISDNLGLSCAKLRLSCAKLRLSCAKLRLSLAYQLAWHDRIAAMLVRLFQLISLVTMDWFFLLYISLLLSEVG